MDAKWSVFGVVTDHLATLVDRRTRRWMPLDYVGFFAFPLAVGVSVFLFEVRIANVQNLIAGVSVFTALLFGLLVHVFSLGLRVAAERLGEGAVRTAKMVDQLHANVAYATLVSLVTTAGLMALIVAYDQAEVARWASAAVITVLVHLFMTLLMVLKRIRSMYAQMRRYAPFTGKG
ncbi:hypothetical protein CQJ94_05580 [Glycomyces fuscus]|nr:hypothetical protein CQJ94_05580 [Glycomyces fuscus]